MCFMNNVKRWVTCLSLLVCAYAQDVVISFGNVTNTSAEVNYSSNIDIGGFQFTFTGGGLLNVSGGESDNLTMVSFNPESGGVIGFDMTGYSIAPGSGLLANLEFSSEPGASLCLEELVISSAGGTTADSEFGGCVTLSMPEITISLGSVDLNNGTAEVNYSSSAGITGFQFDVTGMEVTGVSGGGPLDVNTANNTVIAYSLDLSSIPAGSGTLVVLEGSFSGYELCLNGISATDDVLLDDVSTSLSDCAGTALLSLGAFDSENGTIDVTYSSPVDIAGFQFSVSGISPSAATTEHGDFTVSANSETGIVLGFSFTGEVVPAGSGLLTTLTVDSYENGGLACVENGLFTDSSGSDGSPAGGCTGLPYTTDGADFTLGSVDQEAGTIIVNMENSTDIYGFQFDVTGNISGMDIGDGGSALDAGFTVSAGGSTVLGFSFDGDFIPEGSGHLVTLTFDGSAGADFCLANSVASDQVGEISSTSSGCYSFVVVTASSDEDIVLPDVEVSEDVSVDIDIPAGGLDAPDGTDVEIEVTSEDPGEVESGAAEGSVSVDVEAGLTIDAGDVELAEGSSIEITITYGDGDSRDHEIMCSVDDDGLIEEVDGSNCDGVQCTGEIDEFGTYIVGTPIPDCAGTPGGTAYLDACGTCDDEPSNDCVDSFVFTHSLGGGNNLIALPGYLDNTGSQDMMNGLIGSSGNNVVFLIGQGVGLFNTGSASEPSWSGNLNDISPFSGYWINVSSAYDWTVEFNAPLTACESYPVGGGNNLLSYKWGAGESSTLTAMGGEAFATANFNFIIGQGVGLFNTPGGWSGNLNNLSEGKGYWVNVIDGSIDFRWGMDGCGGAPDPGNQTEFDLSRTMPEEFKFVQSTEQAFYLIEQLNIDGVELDKEDIILAYNDDVLVGSIHWDGAYTPVPVMGRDISEQTAGFSEIGDVPVFKLFDSETGSMVTLDGEVQGWNSLLVTSVSELAGSVSVEIPNELSLNPAFPNPFNPVTTISYNLPYDGMVNVWVYDVTGRQVANLVNDVQKQGSHVIEWNADGQSTGMYLMKLNFGSESRIQKLMLVK